MKRRNRPATEQKLLDSASQLIIEAGFSGSGINQVARSASVDKVLIYRYFGDHAGLLQALADLTDFFLTTRPLFKTTNNPEQQLDAFAEAYLKDLSEPFAAAVFAGSLTADNPVTQRLWTQEGTLWSLLNESFTEQREAWQHTLGIWRGLLLAKATEPHRPSVALPTSLAASSPSALLALAQSGTELAHPDNAELIPDTGFTPPNDDVLPDHLL